jgi:hypothetical protein
MAFVSLSINSLAELDGGKVSAAFLHDLRRIIQDCIDRPGDKTARTITLEFSAKPQVGQELVCEGVEGKFRIKSKIPERKTKIPERKTKIPERKTKAYHFQTDRSGGLFFNANNPANSDQTTLDDINPATGKIERERPAKQS